jgi:hypothetical protein
MAEKVHESGLTIREYLWANHTLLDRTGREVAAATPTTSATPSTPSATTTSSTAVTPTTSSGPTPTQTAAGGSSLAGQPVVAASSQVPVGTLVGGGLALAVLAGLGLLGWRAARRRGQGT